MGSWGVEPWDSDEAADWFAGFFRGIDVPSKIEAAFAHPDAYGTIRAACCMLAWIGRPYVWPGTAEQLRALLETGIALLEAMTRPEAEGGSGFVELWAHEPAGVDAVRQEIEHLRRRQRGIVVADDEPAEDEAR